MLKTYPGLLQIEDRAGTYVIHLPAGNWTLSRYRELVTAFRKVREEYAGHMFLVSTPFPVPHSIAKILAREKVQQIAKREDRINPDLILADFIGVF